MATIARDRWSYDYGAGEAPEVELLLDQSLASQEIQALFVERGIRHSVAVLDGVNDDRPAVYIRSEGPAGTYFYGSSEISFFFLSRFAPPADIAA